MECGGVVPAAAGGVYYYQRSCLCCHWSLFGFGASICGVGTPVFDAGSRPRQLAICFDFFHNAFVLLVLAPLMSMLSDAYIYM